MAAGDNGFRGGNIADASWVFGAYGDYVPGAWSQATDGSLVYGSIQPSIKEGLAKLREWYGNGYLATDFAILSAGDAQESFISGRSGIMAAPPWAHGRTFVYNCLQDWRDRQTDRAKAAYDHRLFLPTVMSRVKNMHNFSV